MIPVAEILRRTAIREEGHGKPGDPDFKPTLWCWVSPSGKKWKADQKSEESN